MEHQNQIIIEKHEAMTLFDVKGDVTSASEPFFNDAYKKPDILEASKIVLVFDEDAYINSGGIAVLIQLLAETKRNNQQIGIIDLSDHFKKIFQMVGITKFTTIFHSVDEAIKRFSSP